jgi:hypothetical protein
MQLRVDRHCHKSALEQAEQDREVLGSVRHEHHHAIASLITLSPQASREICGLPFKFVISKFGGTITYGHARGMYASRFG